MRNKQTQAARLAEHLRQGWMTWGDLTATRISNSPWARLISEGGLDRVKREGEVLVKRERPDGLVEMRLELI